MSDAPDSPSDQLSEAHASPDLPLELLAGIPEE